ncbi:MAG: DUF190 domain-containing protein [Limnohabitans sp.]
MSELTAVRLYFPVAARAKPTSFWHRLSQPSLAGHLLKAAKHAGIEQVVMHPVHAGYMNGEPLEHLHMDRASKSLPICLELMDTETRIRQFLANHQKDLQDVRSVLFRCECL